MRQKACFFDIDGTIWDRKDVIPDSTAEAIAKLKANGHLTFLCSGRSRGHIQDEKLLGLGFDGILAGCGTSVEYRDELLFLYEIPPEQIGATLETVERYAFQPILEGYEYLYFDLAYFGEDPYGQKLLWELKDRHRTICDHAGEWHASKLSCDTKKGHVEECYAELKDRYDFLIHSPGVVEIVPKGFDKKTGIQWISRYLGLDPADTVAFGDSTNDIGMLRAAGIGVAMGNGSEAAKEAADLVTDSIHEDGIYNACRKLQLI